MRKKNLLKLCGIRYKKTLQECCFSGPPPPLSRWDFPRGSLTIWQNLSLTIWPNLPLIIWQNLFSINLFSINAYHPPTFLAVHSSRFRVVRVCIKTHLWVAMTCISLGSLSLSHYDRKSWEVWPNISKYENLRRNSATVWPKLWAKIWPIWLTSAKIFRSYHPARPHPLPGTSWS